MITIVDYGMGNLASVANAFKRFTQDVTISSAPDEISKADKLVLPGVGAFRDACEEIGSRKLREPIIDFIGAGKPFLGICLGLQLLFTRSYEDGEHAGFDIIKGDVVSFDANKALKIPHMGWNTINPQSSATSCQLLKDVPENAYFYFVHSYYVVPEDSSVVATTTGYGVEFCSFLQKDNIYAMQFHPEKSQELGLNIIKNFTEL